jgi:uncharacterized protein YuzE
MPDNMQYSGDELHDDPQDQLRPERRCDGPVQESDEVASGVILDYDKDGNAMGIEILDASQVLGSREMRVELAVAERIASR